MTPLRLLPGRKLELALMVALTLGFTVLLWFTRGGEAAGLIALAFLELLLPLVPATLAAGLLANDPALTLLLSVRRRASLTLLQRLLAVFAVTALIALGVQVLLYFWEVTLVVGGVKQVLVWAAPVLFFSGVAVVAAMLRGQALDGVAAVLVLWGLSLFSIPYLDSVCTQNPCKQVLLSPALSLIRPHDAHWPLNRGILAATGGLLVLVGLALAGAEEHLLRASQAEETT